MGNKSSKAPKKSSAKSKKSSKKSTKTKKTKKISTKKSTSAKTQSPKTVNSKSESSKKQTSSPSKDQKSKNHIAFRENVEIDENLRKLITEDEQEKMKRNLEKALNFLDNIGIEEIEVDWKKFIIVIPFEYEEFSFLSHAVISPDWILIKTSIFELEDFTVQTHAQLFSEVLKGNFLLNNVVYSLDPESKSIWTQCDIPVDIDFAGFKLNYFSLIMAIDYFMKNITPKLNIQLRSTYEKEKNLDVDSRLYI